MVDHVSPGLRDVARSGRFYDAFVLDPDGCRIEAATFAPA